MKPRGKELTFIVKLVSVTAGASLLSFSILYLFMDTGIGTDYGAAFQLMLATYKRMNYYIGLAVLAQLIISCLVVFFIALRYSHKIAGPMYRLKITIQNYLKRENVAQISFRRTDFLHEIAEQFTRFFTALERNKKIFAETRHLIEAADLHDEQVKNELLKQIKSNLMYLYQGSAETEAVPGDPPVQEQ